MMMFTDDPNHLGDISYTEVGIRVKNKTLDPMSSRIRLLNAFDIYVLIVRLSPRSFQGLVKGRVLR